MPINVHVSQHRGVLRPGSRVLSLDDMVSATYPVTGEATFTAELPLLRVTPLLGPCRIGRTAAGSNRLCVPMGFSAICAVSPGSGMTVEELIGTETVHVSCHPQLLNPYTDIVHLDGVLTANGEMPFTAGMTAPVVLIYPTVLGYARTGTAKVLCPPNVHTPLAVRVGDTLTVDAT